MNVLEDIKTNDYTNWGFLGVTSWLVNKLTGIDEVVPAFRSDQRVMLHLVKKRKKPSGHYSRLTEKCKED